jgi:hypothetical protein
MHERGQVVVVALEPVPRDAQPRGERVQLPEALVADHVAPVLEREPGVRVGPQLVDEDQAASIAQDPPAGGDAAEAHFTVGLFSLADALLDAPMDDVLETLPFSDEIRAALLRREGPKGELLSTVTAYEQGDSPRPSPSSPAPMARRSRGPAAPRAPAPDLSRAPP